jgi:hypothetical protein
VHDIASSKDKKGVGSIETIIHEHLLFKKVCAQWVPKMLMFDQKVQCIAMFAEHLHQF